MAITYTPTEVTEVATDDGNRAEMESVAGYYLIHQFKFQHPNNHDTINVEAIVQTTLAPSTQPVYLQIWNTNTSAWETLASDSESEPNVNFQLSGVIFQNLVDYYDELHDLHFPADIYQTNEVTVRVYQQYPS